MFGAYLSAEEYGLKKKKASSSSIGQILRKFFFLFSSKKRGKKIKDEKSCAVPPPKSGPRRAHFHPVQVWDTHFKVLKESEFYPFSGSTL